MTKSLDQLMQDIAALEGDKSKLTEGAKLPANMVEGANQIFKLSGELATANGQAASLTGDKTKLVAGANLPTDLVTAANSIADLTAKLADANGKVTKLEGEKLTLDQAVAKEVAKLGIVPNGEKAGENKQAEKPLTATERVLAAHGCKTLAELEAKHKAKLNGGTAAAK